MAEKQSMQNPAPAPAVAEPVMGQANQLVAPSDEARQLAVSSIINRATLISAGVGIFPIPFFNLIGTTATQAAMMHLIAKQYGKTFASNIIYNTITSVGGALTSTFITTVVSRAALALPIVGMPIAIATRPAFNALVTYVLGNALNSYLRDYQGSPCSVGDDIQKLAESIASRLLSSRSLAQTAAVEAPVAQ